jgi:hypothetical protein
MSDKRLKQLIRRGAAAHERGDHAEEVELWKRVAILEPDYPYWQANLAHAFACLGKPEQAEILFRFVIETSPHVSQAYNNYANLLAEKGVPVDSLFPLFVFALETSETYAHFRRHFMNICVSVALGDAATDDSTWSRIRDNASRFLTRVGDDTTEHRTFVDDVISAYRGYEDFKRLLAEQNWGAATRSLDSLERSFAQRDYGANEVGRITRFRPLVTAAATAFSQLSRLSSDDPLTPAACLEEWQASLGHLRESRAFLASVGNSTFLDLLGWFSAELVRQLRWLATAAAPYDADSHQVPKEALSYVVQTRYAEIGELLEGLLLQTNRICRRASESYFAARQDTERVAVVSRAWLSIRIAAHGFVAEYSGVTDLIGREMLGWNTTPRDRVRRDLERFRAFVESQAHRDFYVDGKPQENIGRALLQAFVHNNGFREVPVRGGRIDVLVLEREATFVIETKVWRGSTYHDDGLTELAEYLSNNAIPNLGGAFYVVFDPTKGGLAAKYAAMSATQPGIDTITIGIALTAPSAKGRVSRTAQKDENT